MNPFPPETHTVLHIEIDILYMAEGLGKYIFNLDVH